MIFAIALLTIIIVLLNLIFLQASLWMSLAALILCLAGGLLLLIETRMTRKLRYLASCLCIAAGMFFLWNAGEPVRPEGVRAYEAMLEDTRAFLEEGDYDQAAETLTELEEIYGPDDNIRLLFAIESLEKGNYEEAYVHTHSVQDKSSLLYYAVMEQIYIADPSQQSVQDIYAIYLEAAQEWPEWTHMQKYAGIALFEQGQYTAAEYYLLRAHTQDEADYQTVYYLGAVDFYQNDYENSMSYFNRALELGADEEVQSDIIWYVTEMNGEGSR